MKIPLSFKRYFYFYSEFILTFFKWLQNALVALFFVFLLPYSSDMQCKKVFKQNKNNYSSLQSKKSRQVRIVFLE